MNTTTDTSRALQWTIYGVAAVVVFVAYASKVVGMFYGGEAWAYDAGWFAYLLSRFDFPPDNPLYVQERGIPSFFAFHVAPVMPLWGALSELLHLSPPLAFAAYQGFFHALLLLVGTALVRTGLRPAADIAVRILVGLALAFSSVALSAMTYLHHEFAMPILFIAACFAWSRGGALLAGIAFLLFLAVRTDAGFHAATFLFAFAAAEWLVHRRLTALARLAAAAGIFAFLYSVAAFAIVHFEFPQFDNFRFSYMGNRFDHLSAGFVVDRFAALLDKRPELWVIFFTAVAIGTLRRSLHTVFGALAVLPWVALHMIALRDVPGELFTYYAFPFLILAAWPLLVPLIVGERGAVPVPDLRRTSAWLAGSAVAWLVYFASPFSDATERAARASAMAGFVPSVSLETQRSIDGFTAALGRLNAIQTTPVYMDEAVASLAPWTSRERIFRADRSGQLANDAPFLFVYFETYEHVREVEQVYAPAAQDCYMLSGTSLRMFARDIAPATILALEPHVAQTTCQQPR